MAAVNTNKIYSYLDSDNYSFLTDLKEEIKSNGNTKVSYSKIIKLAIIELRNNNSYNDIQQKLIQKEMI